MSNSFQVDLPFKKIIFMWSILLLGYFLNIFHSLTTAILQPYLMNEFNLSSTSVTNIGSMFFYSYLVMQIPTGILADKYGVKIVSGVGLLVASLGAVIFALAPSPFYLYLGRAITGFGIATMFVCILKFQVAWIHPNIITTITGLACFFGMLGGIFAQSPLAWLVESIGWRFSALLIGSATLINAVLVFIFVKNSPTPIVKTTNSNKLIYSALFKIIFNWRTWAPISVYTMYYGSYIIIVGYSGTAWLSTLYQLSIIEASSYVIATVLGSTFGYVVIGTWSDRIHNRRIPMLVTGLIYIGTWSILGFFGDIIPLTLMTVLLFCIGFFSCSYVLSFSCVQDSNPKEYSGISGAIVNMGGYLGPIFLPLIFVYTQNSHQEPMSIDAFLGAFKIIFFTVSLGFIFSFWTKEPPQN